MKEATRRRLSELILEELSEKIRHDESLREKLEPFTHLSVEKIADTLLKHLEALVTEDFKNMIQMRPDRDVSQEEEAVDEERSSETGADGGDEEGLKTVLSGLPEEPGRTPAETIQRPGDSIMIHFGVKEPFPSQEFNVELAADDWLYLYGFTYSPDSTGKGVPTKMLAMQGVDHSNNIFLVDFGDVRCYMNKLTLKDYTLNKLGKPVVTGRRESQYKLEHEKILNTLRSEEVMVPLACWTIMQGMEDVLKKIEERYVDMLRTMIEVHDAVEWDLEVFAFDHHVLQLPSITTGSKSRTTRRGESKHAVGSRRDDVMIDKVIFREKTIAQEIHNQLILTSQESKLDYMVRLETAFMDDWKSILSARYAVAKDKRKQFWQTVKSLQEEYAEYELMMKIRTRVDHFTL